MNEPVNNQDGKSVALNDLTDQNWLFLKCYLESGDVVKAYKLAGYKGEAKSAPYELFRRLKSSLEEIGNTNIASKSRLLAEVNKLLELPLATTETSLTFSERLRLLKFVASITPEVDKPKQNVSLLIINRFADSKGDTHNSNGLDTNLTPSSELKDVSIIDATIVPDQDSK